MLSHKRLNSEPELRVCERTTLGFFRPKVVEFTGSNFLDRTFFPQRNNSLPKDHKGTINSDNLNIDSSHEPVNCKEVNMKKRMNLQKPLGSEAVAQKLQNLSTLDYIQQQNRIISHNRHISCRGERNFKVKNKAEPLFTHQDQEISFSNLMNTFYPHKNFNSTSTTCKSYVKQISPSPSSNLDSGQNSSEERKTRTKTRWTSPFDARIRKNLNSIIPNVAKLNNISKKGSIIRIGKSDSLLVKSYLRLL